MRRSFDHASHTFDAASVVHGEIRKRLLERLDVVRLVPNVVVDLGAATGQGSRTLKQRYRAAHVIALDFSEAMLRESARQQTLFRRFARVAADARQLPLQTGSADLVFSNLMLQWCNEPDRVFAEVRRVLRPNGLFTFTTLGPDTLKELRTAWQPIDARPHVHRFIDMHDIGDALARSRFSDPVLDTERLTVTYATLDALRSDLKLSGSRNLAAGRASGLTGRHALQALRSHLGSSGALLAFGLEVVYGHAWVGQPRVPASTDGEVRIPVGSISKRKDY